MMDNQSFKGYWKLPQTEKFSHYGELTFDSRSGNILEILGSLGDQDKRTGKEVHKVIHGFSIEGKKLTLLNSEGFGSNRAPGISVTKFDVELSFGG